MRPSHEAERLVCDAAHLPRLCVSRLWIPLGRGIDRDDLISESWLAIMRAAQLWDEDYGTSFETYARQAIMNRLYSVVRRAQPMPEHESPPASYWIVLRNDLAALAEQCLGYDAIDVLRLTMNGLTLDQIGSVYGRSRYAVGRDRARAIRQLQRHCQ